KGSPDQIGSTLELSLRPAMLVSVTGRLLDPRRRPLAKADFSTIRWQEGPRITWLASARQGKTDPAGRFRVDGLERGQSFSILGGAPGRSEEDGFESPRFATPGAAVTVAATQELGDVVVHPVEGAQQVLQLYGFDSTDQLARLTALLPAPPAAAVAGARAALARYNAALGAGDFDAAYHMTSRLSLDWAENRRDFLLRGR